ncbi:hypothetical protein ZWY2020_060049 [Hordeum vulgare]|nr:hypothetical protein ZWY2020_060049 [Hordeum vulgare]
MAARMRPRADAVVGAGALIQCFAGGSYCFGILAGAQGVRRGTTSRRSTPSPAFFKDVGANVGSPLRPPRPRGRREPPAPLDRPPPPAPRSAPAEILPPDVARRREGRARPLPLVILPLHAARRPKVSGPILNTADVVTP